MKLKFENYVENKEFNDMNKEILRRITNGR